MHVVKLSKKLESLSKQLPPKAQKVKHLLTTFADECHSLEETLQLLQPHSDFEQEFVDVQDWLRLSKEPEDDVVSLSSSCLSYEILDFPESPCQHSIQVLEHPQATTNLEKDEALPLAINVSEEPPVSFSEKEVQALRQELSQLQHQHQQTLAELELSKSHVPATSPSSTFALNSSRNRLSSSKPMEVDVLSASSSSSSIVDLEAGLSTDRRRRKWQRQIVRDIQQLFPLSGTYWAACRQCNSPFTPSVLLLSYIALLHLIFLFLMLTKDW